MTISLVDRKKLWGRAASRCSFPDCRLELVQEATESDRESIVGEECHIVARKSIGARGASVLTDKQRDEYTNLILLCNNHHKIVDDQPNCYNADVLQKYKQAHEEWVRHSLDYDKQKQLDEEIYASYIDEWVKSIKIHEWTPISSRILGIYQPSMSLDTYNKLKETRNWLLSRKWPERYPALEDAFINFEKVLTDFLKTFERQKITDWQQNIVYTKKFYKPFEMFGRRGVDRFINYVVLVQDLMLELTRAANYVCDRVREDILSSFRLKEGKLIVTSDEDAFSLNSYVPEYRDKERTAQPYPGLSDFQKIRRKRDLFVTERLCISSGK